MACMCPSDLGHAHGSAVARDVRVIAEVPPQELPGALK